jgi:uncharacterized protein GlcG (DUF336 family)
VQRRRATRVLERPGPNKLTSEARSRPGEALQARWRLAILRCTNTPASPLEGGIPIIVDSKVVGAIGVSGGTSVQDGQVAKAGAEAAK